MIVGAYAAAAPGPVDARYGELLARLAADPRVSGLEVPAHHLADPMVRSMMVAAAPPNRTFSVTCFPSTMLALLDDPEVGLASTDSRGRAAAVAQVRRIADDVAALAAEAGGTGCRVHELFVHSAPRAHTPAALDDSLGELLAELPGDVELVIEHCDAASDEHVAEKGFMSLADEIAVAAKFGGRVGLVINWARSAIETRSVDGPVDHLTRVTRAGLLRRLMFSGVADRATDYAPSWGDGHLPVSTAEPASLLTSAEVRRTLAASGARSPLGVKVSVRPTDADPDHRFAVIAACLDVVGAAVAT